MSETSRSDADSWQFRYTKQRSNLELNTGTTGSDDGNESRGYPGKQNQSINPMNDYEPVPKSAGLETTHTMDNVVFGNAELAYIVGRHDLKTNSQLQLKLRSSQDLPLGYGVMRSNSNVTQQKTPSTMNGSSFAHQSSNSEVTVSTNMLFDSPKSRTNESNSNSGNSKSAEGNKNASVGSRNNIFDPNNNSRQTADQKQYQNYKATKPLPILETQSPTNRSLLSNNSQTISEKLQQAAHQRKTIKGHQMNTKHLSVYQLQKKPEHQISREKLLEITKLELLHNTSLKSFLVLLFVPVTIPIVLLMISKSQFLKWIISKETSFLDLDVEPITEENPYSSFSNYHSNELGYFGIISMVLEHSLQKQLEMGNEKFMNDNKANTESRERHVGFTENPEYIPHAVADGVYIDVDYTRLKHYLDNIADISEHDSEFLSICLTQWNVFIRRMHVYLWGYFAMWLAGAVVCIVLVPALA